MNGGMGFAYEGDYYADEFYDLGGYGSGEDLFFIDDGGYGGYGGYDPNSAFFNFDFYDPNADQPYVNLPTSDQDYWSVEPPIYSPSEPAPSSDYNPFYDYFDYYLSQGWDPEEAGNQAAQDVQGHIEQVTSERLNPPIVGDWWMVQYTPPLPPRETPPYVPYEPPAPEPPPLPPSPATQQPNLPPACPTGSYHPYPIGHPRQNECAPFPAAPKTQPQQPRPPQPQSSGSGSRPPSSQPQPQQNCPSSYCKHPVTGQCIPIPQGYTRDASQRCVPQQQPQQQQCPTGYYRDPSTGQCKPIPRCVTPGTVFDARTGRCVPYSQAQQPLCPTGYWPNFNTQRCEPIPQCQPGLVFDQSKGLCVQPSELSDGDILSELKKLPWWLWLALGGFLLLNREEEGRKTTVTYRRATA